MTEPNSESETELENAVALGIEGASGSGNRVVVLRGFGLDLAVFTELGCDEDESAFREKLRVIARQTAQARVLVCP